MIPQLDLTGVHADPQPQPVSRPVLRVQRQLDLHRRGDCVARPWERGDELTTFALLRWPYTTAAPDDVTHQRSRAATAIAMPEGSASHARTDPSMSANSNVTVPAGNTKPVSSLTDAPRNRSDHRTSARPIPHIFDRRPVQNICRTAEG